MDTAVTRSFVQPKMTSADKAVAHARLDLQDLLLALRPDLCAQFGFDTPKGRPRFIDWLITSGLLEYKALEEDPAFRAQVLGSARGDLSGVQVLLWQARPDVQQLYPLPAMQAEYLKWFYRHGVGEHGVWSFLQPHEKELVLTQESPWQESFQDRMVDDTLHPPAQPWQRRPWGVNVVGYAFGQLGIGEDARMAAAALQAAGMPMCMVNFEPGADIAQNDTSMQAHVQASGPYAVNLFCLTALEHGRFFAVRGGRQLQGRYNIGYWPWELGQWPAQWRQMVHLVDEVWVSSRHTYDAVAPVCQAQSPPVPVHVMPMAAELGPVAAPGGRSGVRKRFGLPRKARLFCFAFDLNSSVHRKNPQAVVDAFLRAFPADQWPPDQVGLVIKVHPPRRPNPAWSKLKALAAQDPRLHVIEQTLQRPQLLGLYQACDCFVSLHRAEGFGRGIAEALQLGLHVITTGYSGNLDFCQAPEWADRIDLVRYRLVKLKQGQYPYAEGQVWANADVRHAAQCMAAFVERFAPPGTDARAGKPPHAPPASGWAVFAPQAIGARYRQHLQRIGQRGGAPNA
jgi:glycosyltransferase involved in cell wall biosynthesis